MMMTLARVLEVHPESHAVDVEMLQDGKRLSGVQVLSPSAGGDFGLSGLGRPVKGDEWRERILAAVAFLDRVPVVVGFLYPQVSQMLFEDKERAVARHQSDVYVTVDGKGNTEVVHPSGPYIVMSETGAPTALAGRDYDKVWKTRRNAGRKVWIVANIPGQARISMSPEGDIEIWAKRNIAITAGQHIGLKAPRIDLN